MNRAVALLLPLALAACDTGPSRQQVLGSLVGHTESDAIRTLGAPNRVIEANGHKFLAYDNRQLGYAASPYFGGFGPFGYGYFGGGGVVPIVYGCETTIEVVGGLVTTYSLRGNAC